MDSTARTSKNPVCIAFYPVPPRRLLLLSRLRTERVQMYSGAVDVLFGLRIQHSVFAMKFY